MESLALGARLALAGALAVAAAAKVARRSELPATLAGFGVPFPRRVAWLLPAAEATLAVVLVAVPGGTWPSLVAVGVLGTFTGAVVANLARGREAPCPCFGAASERPVSAGTVLRNGWLMALAVLGAGPVEGAESVPTAAAAVTAAAVTAAVVRRLGCRPRRRHARRCFPGSGGAPRSTVTRRARGAALGPHHRRLDRPARRPR
jgi:hypothetical protein